MFPLLFFSPSLHVFYSLYFFIYFLFFIFSLSQNISETGEETVDVSRFQPETLLTKSHSVITIDDIDIDIQRAESPVISKRNRNKYLHPKAVDVISLFFPAILFYFIFIIIIKKHESQQEAGNTQVNHKNKRSVAASLWPFMRQQVISLQSFHNNMFLSSFFF